MELKVFLFFYLLTIACAHVIKRIAGGKNAEPYAFPNIVAVYGLTATEPIQPVLFCGGIIYNQKWIATTADCVSVVGIVCLLENVRVFAGRWNLSGVELTMQERSIELIRIHDEYEEDEIGSSINLALLKVHIAWIFNEYISVLPFSMKMTYPSGTAIIIGWGSSTMTEIFTESITDVLQILNVEIVPIRACQYAINKTLQDKEMVITENSFNAYHFCTGTFTSVLRGPFYGDFGGPLMQLNEEGQYEVVGLISLGIGLPELGIHIHLSPLIEWINTEIAAFSDV